jgi:hypothetical protein
MNFSRQSSGWQEKEYQIFAMVLLRVIWIAWLGVSHS